MAALPPLGGWPGWGRSLLTALHQLPFEQQVSALAAGGASALAQLLLHDTGGGQPQPLVSFLEDHIAGSMQQADRQHLVSGMLDMCKGDQAITRATTRVVEMSLAASARPQAGGSVEARLVAEPRWVIMEAMFAPKRLRHAAAMGVARNMLMGLQAHDWHLRASARGGQGSAAADGAEAEVVRECIGLLACLGCEHSLTSDRAEAVAVPTRLAELVLEAVADLELWDLGAPLLRALRLEPNSWGSDRAAEVARKKLLDLPTAERRVVLCLLLSAALTWPGIEPGTAARALVEVAELLPMCAADGDLRTTQRLVLAAYREAAALAASLAAATRRDDTGADPPHRCTSILAVHLALSVLDGKLPLDRSISESSGGEAEPVLPLDEQSVAAKAMSIANNARFFRGSLTVFLTLLRRRGTSGVDNACVLQMVLDAINDPSASEDEQGRLLADLTDAVGEDTYYVMEEATAGGQAGCAIVAGGQWLASMRRHRWSLPSSWAVPA
ncbi:hypothetical protein FOA52_009745 [Chlamydomonas sp. UWO 241]|nr:hypothetical protein FOA52_009745 [Chlamydomonas sp. UWO 241]